MTSKRVAASLAAVTLAVACVPAPAPPPPAAPAPPPPAAPAATAATAAAAAPAAVVTLDPARRHQALVGFGASIAWYQDKLVPNPPEGAYQMLFPDLGIDILRLRNRYGRVVKAFDANIAQDVEIYRKATEALGRPPKVLISSWTPPATLKASKVEDCKNNPDCTLVKENGKFVYDKFAEYWRASVAAYRAAGISPDWVSIQNEPSFIPPFWEGCKFEATETDAYPGYDKALAATHKALAKLPKPPAMLGPEVLGIHHGLLDKYLKAMNQDLVAGVAHHIYEKGPDNKWDWLDPGPDSYVDELQAVPALTRKPLFQTEFGTEDDQGHLGGFETALMIHHSLVAEGVVAFLWWDLYWIGDKGLVGIDYRPIRPRDQYFSLRHFARFTDTGHVRVGAASSLPDTLRVSAFASPDGNQLTAIVINSGPEAATVRVDAPGWEGAGSAVYRTVFRPKASERWKEMGALPAARTVDLPARSVATIVLKRA
jgi:glucuronoarabinoxylan endo-1,4-beta-xylanase